MTLERTKPQFPTYGPGDGRSWGDYFSALRTVNAEPVAEVDAQPEVIEPGHELTDEEISSLNARSTPAQVVKRLRASGWLVRVRRARALIPAVLRKSDSDDAPAGSVRFEAREEEVICVAATKSAANGRVGLIMVANWNSKRGFEYAETFDPVLGRELRMEYRTAREPNEIEIEEGVEPPMALAEWLDIVAPRPQAKKKPRKVAETKEEPVEQNVWVAA